MPNPTDTTPLRLSDAIRIGARMGDQISGALIVKAFSSTTHEPVYNSCALGSAALAIGYRGDEAREAMDLLIARFPELRYVLSACPICNLHEQPLYYILMHLNDKHDVAREIVAAWVDQQTLEITPVGELELAGACIEAGGLERV